MTNQAILTKAITQAIDGGWDNTEEWRIFNGDLSNLDDDHIPPSQLIFNHNFAKALWGEEDVERYARIAGSNQLIEVIAWEHHLQQMVIAEDPIEYLGKHI